MSTYEKIIAIIRKLSGKTEIHMSDSLIDDIGLDSLNMVYLLLDVENTFEFELKESDMNPFDLKMVSDVIRLVERYINDISITKNEKIG